MSARSRIAALAGALMLWTTAAAAQGITVPNTFVNGTVADATQVNANFTSLANNALNRTGGTMTGGLTTLAIAPTSTGASDIGTSGLKYKDLYLSGTITAASFSANTWTAGSGFGLSVSGPLPITLGGTKANALALDAGLSLYYSSTLKRPTILPVSQSIANNGIVTIGNGGDLIGLLVVVADEDNSSALYIIEGGAGVTALIGFAGPYTVTAGTAASINVYWDGGASQYKLENKRGATRTIRMLFLGQAGT